MSLYTCVGVVLGIQTIITDTSHIHSQRVVSRGNANDYATWRDESENKQLRRLGGRAHSMKWESRVLAEWDREYGLGTLSRPEKKRQRES